MRFENLVRLWEKRAFPVNWTPKAVLQVPRNQESQAILKCEPESAPWASERGEPTSQPVGGAAERQAG